MCSNYVSVSSQERLLHFFGAFREDPKNPPEVWPTGLAPFIRRAEPGSGNKCMETGHFGLIPGFAKEIAFGRKTYNARSETVHDKPSFRDAWRRGQRCIVPAEILYEPNWETGKAVRWAIYQAGHVPMGIAGIYARWVEQETGEEKFSFAMLTVNADNHPFYCRFHRPGEEKRMPVVLDPENYDDWLACSVQEAPQFFRTWLGPLEAEPAPLPPKAPRADSGRVVRPRAARKPPDSSEPRDPDEPQLF